MTDAMRNALRRANVVHPELAQALLEHLDPPRVTPAKRRVKRTPGSEGRSSRGST